MRVYRWLLRLYPLHVRTVYGDEMLADFERRSAATRFSPLAAWRLLAAETFRIVPDAISERIASLSSHPSFHGRRPTDLGVVRPPNVGKREWFHGGGDLKD